MIDDRHACILLNSISGIGYARYRKLCNAFGSPSAACSASLAELEAVPGLGSRQAQLLVSARDNGELDAELALARQAGVEIITLFDEKYPDVLRTIHDPPMCLYVRGTLPTDWSQAIAVVGSRKMSIYGGKCTKMFTEQAVAANWIVVSGLAYGVDAEAHQTTVDNQGITVAVLGGGLARIHPQEHIPLARRIVETGGAVITEFPMRFPVSRLTFPRRNRIVAGLSRAILVIEAGLNSGALITAQTGLNQGREIFAVPGHIDNPQAMGCHKLLKDGAHLAESFGDVLDAMELVTPLQISDENALPLTFSPPADLPETKVEIQPRTPQEKAPLTPRSNEEQQILDCLKQRGVCSFDQLTVLVDLTSGQILSALMKLEMDNIIVQLPGRNYNLKK